MAIALANSRDGEGRLSMASPSQWSSFDQHQREMRTGRGNPWGSCAPLLVAGYQPQDWMASRHAGFLRDDLPNLLKTCRGLRAPGLSRIQIGRFLPLPQLRARAVTGCASLFHSVRSAGCTRPRAQSLAHKQVIQAVAYGPHLSRLSSSVAFAGFNTSEATDGRVPNSAGAFQKTEGELPNVGS